jgi:hypothetical protein
VGSPGLKVEMPSGQNFSNERFHSLFYGCDKTCKAVEGSLRQILLRRFESYEYDQRPSLRRSD